MARGKSAFLAVKLTQAEQVYITTPYGITLEDVALDVGVPLATIKKAASEGKWSDLREQHQAMVRVQVQQELAPAAIEDMKRLQGKVFRALELQIERVVQALDRQVALPVKSLKDEATAIRALQLVYQELGAGVQPQKTPGEGGSVLPAAGTLISIVNQIATQVAGETGQKEERVIDGSASPIRE